MWEILKQNALNAVTTLIITLSIKSSKCIFSSPKSEVLKYRTPKQLNVGNI